MLHHRSSCLLALAMDGHMFCGVISSCQSAATSEIVKRSGVRVHRGAVLYQVPDLYLYYYLFIDPALPYEHSLTHSSQQ